MSALLHFDPFGAALSPLFVAAVALCGWLYLRGRARPRRLRPDPAPWQDALFAAGLAVMLLAMSAPLAPAGATLFSVLQVQNLMLRLLGPLLIAAAQPWGLIRAGLSRRARRQISAWAETPLLRLVHHPVVAAALMVASLALWLIPALHALAREVPALGLVAQAGMAIAGIWYLAILLDPRDEPAGASRGARALSGLLVILSNIFLGIMITLKSAVLYGPPGARGPFDALSDEATGGYLIWAPSSMIVMVALVLVLNGWNRAEERRWKARHQIMRQSNAAALEFPETAAELWLKVALPNRRLARSLGIVVVVMFATVIATTITMHSAGR